MPESRTVYRAPRYQLLVGLGFALPYLLICGIACAALLATGSFGTAVVFLPFTAFGAFMTYHLGWRISRELELRATSLRWRAAFRQGEVAVGRIRAVSQIGQRRNSSWKLDITDGSPIYLANSRTVGPFLAEVERAARATGH